MVRALKVPSDLRLKIAQFAELFMSTPKPMCWLFCWLKVALNSSERPDG